MNDAAILYLQEVDANCDCLNYILSAQSTGTANAIDTEELMSIVISQKSAIKKTMELMKSQQTRAATRGTELSRKPSGVSNPDPNPQTPLSPRSSIGDLTGFLRGIMTVK